MRTTSIVPPAHASHLSESRTFSSRLSSPSGANSPAAQKRARRGCYPRRALKGRTPQICSLTTALCCRGRESLGDLGDAAGTNGAATLTDSEAEAGLHSDGLDELNGDLGGVTGHDHVGALGEGDDTG